MSPETGGACGGDDGDPDLVHCLARAGTPNLEWFGSWNDWAVALLDCITFDVFSGREAAGRRA